MSYDDAGLTGLINASNAYDVGFSSLPDYWSQPLAANEYLVDQGYQAPLMSSYYQPAAAEEPSLWDDLSKSLSGMKLKDWGAFGLGALSALGNYKAYKDKRAESKYAMEADRTNRELGSGDDFAKMHALAQIIQARQGINLDPSLAYAQAVRQKMGLGPDNATEFAGVDVGGPMKVGLSSQDRLDAINRATNVNFAEGGGVWGGGLARLLASHSPQLLAARQAQEQRQQNAAGFGMNETPSLAKLLKSLRDRQMQLQQQSAVEQPQRFSGSLSSFIGSNPQFMAESQQPPQMGASAGLLARIPQMQFQQPAQIQQPQQYSGFASAVGRNPQFMAAIQQRGVLPQMNMAAGGDVQGLLAGSSPGQADDVNASLSHGEYVFDADTVAALGDGNTEAGARELDRMREAIRQHKRSAPASKIPPPSKGALAYLKGAK